MYLSELQGKMEESYRIQLEKQLHNYFERNISQGHFMALLAEIDGEAVSFGGMVIKEIPGDAYQTSYLEGEILNMYTIPQYRRKGLSSLILKQLLKEAHQAGIRKVALHTSKDGEKLYRQNNFSEPVYPYLERIIEGSNDL